MADGVPHQPRRTGADRTRWRESLLLFVGVPFGWGALFMGLYWLYTAYEPFSIPAGSMQPTLIPGDYVMARQDYYRSAEPVRGDLVVFRTPGGTPGALFIKRVVGLPGEEIRMVRGVLHINGTPVDRRAIADLMAVAAPGFAQPAPAYEETLPGGRSHRIIERRGDASPLDDTEAYLVPAEHYFVLGDNRDNSADSRVFGPVPAALIRHRPLFIFWSRDPARIGMRVR